MPGSALLSIEPLVRDDDATEYRRALERHLAGIWDDERWTAFRLRYGIYGQRQPGVQMVRIKLPGGVMPTAWLRTLAKVNRAYAQGDAHITTRQDIQIYSVPLARTADMLDDLTAGGLTTREACGNTLRNMTSCALAGACPRELVDAGTVASQLAQSWIRHPLVQHMPRKVKIAVSGCATDCGGSAIHDLAFVAVERDGVSGFRVLAAGGLGSAPRAATEILDFVGEEELPAVVEAVVRLHQRYSDRVNRNAARLKFLVKRFGEDKFVGLFREEFDRVRGLPQRPWPRLSWRRPDAAAAKAEVAPTPVGVLPAHDGTLGVVLYVPLGLLSSDQLDALHDIAAAAGVRELRATRDQKLALLGVAPDKVEVLTRAVRAIGLDVPAHPDDVPDVKSCPGTTTCRIGITSSQGLAREIEAEGRANPAARGLSVHLSGCQNSCGLHHVADIGLHGMAKKIDGRAAPHYQLHLGGDIRTGTFGLSGPIVPARLGDQAVRLLRDGYRDGRGDGESVRDWARRQGKDGLAHLLAPLDGSDADGLFVDWGEAEDFAGAPQARAECAASFALDDLLADLADDALIQVDRLLAAGRSAEAVVAGDQAVVLAARRALAMRGLGGGQDDEPAEGILAALRAGFGDEPALLSAFDAAGAAGARARSGSAPAVYREAVALLIDQVRDLVERPPVAEAAVGDWAAVLGGIE